MDRRGDVLNSGLPFALAAAAGLGGYWVLFVALHVVPTGYDPVRHAVSDYAVGRYGGWFRTALVASSVGVACLAAGLALGVGTPPVPQRDVALLAGMVACRIGMAVFPTDPEGQRRTRTGLLHYAFAVASFTCTYLVVSHLGGPLGRLTPWHDARGLLDVLALVAAPALAMVVVTMVPRFRRVFGLFERLFLVSTNLWLLTVAVLLVVRTV